MKEQKRKKKEKRKMASTPTTPDLSKDPRFSFNPTLIQTAQDAAYAYLTKVITEEEFRAAAAKYGVVEPWTLFATVDVGAYEVVVPDDLLAPPIQSEDTVKARIEAANTVPEGEKLPPAVELSTSK